MALGWSSFDCVVAQTHNEEDHSHNPYADPTVGPLVLPTAGEYLDGDTAVGGDKSAGDKGLATFVEVTSNQKTGLLTPYYRFSPALAFKARVPLILGKTQQSYDGERTARGLGDIAIDGEYTRAAGPGAEWRFQASVKLPTGDHEKMVDLNGVEQVVPLGTGSMDILARGLYAKTDVNYDWIASLIFRKNDSTENVVDYGTYQITTNNTNGNQVVLSSFARRRAKEQWWLHCGVSIVKFFDGASKTTYTDGTPDSGYDLLQSGTLIDIYPGVGYAMSRLSPFVGLRIPVKTSYDDTFASTDRDMAFILQFTYNPDKMGN